MTKPYDIIVIGAGSAGLSTALFTGKVGLRTLLIDKSERHIGGDCLNWGCVPSKALIHVARIIHSASEARQFGLSVSGTPDLGKVMAYVSRAQAHIREHENSAYLAGQGIDVVLGEASFTSRRSVRVGERTFNGKKIVIATGSRPSHPAIAGIDMVKRFDNESIFNVSELPSRMLVLGAGPVGVEMAQVFRRLSCEVTLVGRNERILPADPKEVTEVLRSRLVNEGITIHTGAVVDAFLTSTSCRIRHHDGHEETLHFDAVFVATRRTLSIESLNLAVAGVETVDSSITNNPRLATSNPHVFVCGDVAGKHMFSHAAEQHARVLLNNFFSPLRKKVDDSRLSWVTFSDPQVATFGVPENNLQKAGTAYEKLVFDFGEDDRAVVDDYQYGKLILYVSVRNVFGRRRILGGSMIAPQAGEMIQELILAMNQSLDVKALFEKIYPYPVASRVNQFIIVQHQEKRLTGSVKGLLKLLFRVMS